MMKHNITEIRLFKTIPRIIIDLIWMPVYAKNFRKELIT